MEDKLLVVCKYNEKSFDLLIPKDIPVDYLIAVLHQKLRKTTVPGDYIRTENPTRLLSGNIPVSSFGLHDGSALFV